MLERCLKALRDTGYPSMHIIVVDNGGSFPAWLPLLMTIPMHPFSGFPKTEGMPGVAMKG
nr:hypothetical protein [Chlorobium phaeovibrioides]